MSILRLSTSALNFILESQYRNPIRIGTVTTDSNVVIRTPFLFVVEVAGFTEKPVAYMNRPGPLFNIKVFHQVIKINK